MSGPQHHPSDNLTGSRRNGGDEGNGNSRGNSYGNCTSERISPASTSLGYDYDPNRDPLLTRAPRSSRSDHSHLDCTVKLVDSYTAPVPVHPQNQPSRPYNAPHHSLTDYSSSHLFNPAYGMSASDFNASPAFQTTSPAGVFPQPNRQPYYPPVGGPHPNQAVDRHAGPYDAVGHIRRDGEVFDKEEVYEEYRPYDPHVHRREQRGYYESNKTSR